VPLPPGPQSVSPAPLASQLVPAVVDPVQAPLAQVPVAHAHGLPHWPFEPHICNVPLSEHCVAAGAHPFGLPLLDPELLDPELLDPELLDPELLDPELLDPEPLDPEPLDPEPLDPWPLLGPALPAQPPRAWAHTPPPAMTDAALRK